MASKRKKLTRSKLDVLAHSLVPKHLILTKNETDELLKQYSIDLVDLPKIYIDDPVSIALGSKEGDVVKIIRNSNTDIVDTVLSYRVIVPRRRE